MRSIARKARPSPVCPCPNSSGTTGAPTRASASASRASRAAAASDGTRPTFTAARRPSAILTAGQVVAKPPLPSGAPSTSNPETEGRAPISGAAAVRI